MLKRHVEDALVVLSCWLGVALIVIVAACS